MKKECIELCKKAYPVKDSKNRVLKAVEEMAELQKELLKNVNSGKDNAEKILDEIADVYITLE
ncbi:MAG: hypothetical protein LBL47_00830, partial [Lactobacillus sp.]|nr:hypothetical protein [Lactobacillus sp.]